MGKRTRFALRCRSHYNIRSLAFMIIRPQPNWTLLFYAICVYPRCKAPSNPQQFSDILLGGLAPDGGLYLPEHYPQVSGAELTAWRTLSYADLAFEILKKFATDIPEADLKALTAKTYTKAVYRNARPGDNAADITPLRVLEQNDVKGGQTTLILQALSNGPTLAFKDMAMQLLGNLFEYTLAKQGAELNIFGATSGDTGSAAEYAMRGKKGIRVFMLSPHKKMSAFQTAQMFSLQDPNIHQYRRRRRVRRLPGHGQGRLERLAVQGCAKDRHRQFDQLGAGRGAGRVLLPRLSESHHQQ